MIRVRFKVGVLKLAGDTGRLGAAVTKLRQAALDAQQRARDIRAAEVRLRARLFRIAERAFLNG